MTSKHLKNGFVYNDIYFKYNKIVAVSDIEVQTKHVRDTFMDWDYYKVEVLFRVAFCDSTREVGRRKIRDKPKYTWDFWNGNLSDWFSKLRNTKQYQLDIAEYNNALLDYNQLVTDSDKIVAEYTAELTELRETIINKLDLSDNLLSECALKI